MKISTLTVLAAEQEIDGSRRFRTGDWLSWSNALLCIVLSCIGTEVGGVSSKRHILVTYESDGKDTSNEMIALTICEVGGIRCRIPPTFC